MMICNWCSLLCDTFSAVRTCMCVHACVYVCGKCVRIVIWHLVSPLQPQVHQRVSQLLVTSVHLFTALTEEVLCWWLWPLSSSCFSPAALQTRELKKCLTPSVKSFLVSFPDCLKRENNGLRILNH